MRPGLASGDVVVVERAAGERDQTRIRRQALRVEQLRAEARFEATGGGVGVAGAGKRERAPFGTHDAAVEHRTVTRPWPRSVPALVTELRFSDALAPPSTIVPLELNALCTFIVAPSSTRSSPPPVLLPERLAIVQRIGASRSNQPTDVGELDLNAAAAANFAAAVVRKVPCPQTRRPQAAPTPCWRRRPCCSIAVAARSAT